MNKIIQLLRLSRLVLLVILLLIAVIAKIARAETAELFYNGYDLQAYASCQAACAAIDMPIHKMLDNPIGNIVGSCYPTENHMQNNWGTGSCIRGVKTCEAKELTHNGVSDGIDGTPEDLHWLRAPEGIDAGDWYSDRFSSCENNCLVSNTRKFFEPSEFIRPDRRSITEDNGVSRSLFYKRQTGAVCVPQKKKADDPPRPPAPDAGDSADGASGSDTGNADGQNNGQGSQGEGNGSSGSGEGGQANQGSGNSNDGSAGGSGSGGGKGGVNGSGGQTGPGGGGTGGGQGGGNASSEGEGSTGDGQSGSGENGGTGGNGGGQGGSDGSGEGDVDGDGEAGGHYFPCPSGKGSYKKGTEPSAECKGEGKGDGDGEGSISGGSCEANQAPDCKGDPIQCYIAREQWRTACAASGQSNSVESEGNCESNTPPKCKGDAVQCYMAKQQWQQGCAAAAAQGAINDISQYGEGQQGYLDELAREGNPDGILDGIKTDTIDLVGKLNTGLVKLPNACPTFPPIDMGIYGRYDIDTQDLCSVLRTLGRILLAMSYIWGFGIIVRAM